MTRLSGCRHCRQPDNSRNGRCQCRPGRIALGIGALFLTFFFLGFWWLLALVETPEAGDQPLVLAAWLGFNVIMTIDMWILFKKNKAATQAPATRK